MLKISDHPLVLHKLTLLRNIHTPHPQFRQLVREIALLLAHEATEDLTLSPTTVETPMGTAPGHQLQEQIGLVPILLILTAIGLGFWRRKKSKLKIDD